MPEPMRGLVAVAELGSAFEVDVVVARLRRHGIDATASGDPAMRTAAPFLASDRVFEVLVREGDAAAALEILHEPEPAPDPGTEVHDVTTEDDDRVGSPPRPRWMLVVAWLIVLALVLPLALGIIFQLAG